MGLEQAADRLEALRAELGATVLAAEYVFPSGTMTIVAAAGEPWSLVIDGRRLERDVA